MATLEAVARTLAAETAGRKPPAALFLFTDPVRTPDPVALAKRTPAGAAVIYRAFGAEDAPRIARALRSVTRARGVLLLVGADEALAGEAEADGLHLPERRLIDGVALRGRHPGWWITGAAHDEAAVEAANAAALDAVMLSPVFASRSGSAGTPLGLQRLGRLAAQATAPAIALGGVNAKTAPDLIGSGVAGLAAVEAWLEA